MSDNYPYQIKWERIKRREKLKKAFSGSLSTIGIFVWFAFISIDVFWKILIGLPIVAAMAVLIELFVKGRFKCPRCGENFYTSYLPDNANDYCRNCGLPIYFGSDHFVDHWGNEQARQLIYEQARRKLKTP